MVGAPHVGCSLHGLALRDAAVGKGGDIDPAERVVAELDGLDLGDAGEVKARGVIAVALELVLHADAAGHIHEARGGDVAELLAVRRAAVGVGVGLLLSPADGGAVKPE